MKKNILWMCIVLLSIAATSAQAQLNLPSSSPYTETFDGISSGLPVGWTVRTGASATALGTAQTLTTTATAWNNTTGRFNNYASADALSSSATAAAQASATDRALGVRQTAAFGDIGAAFVLQIANTTGKSNFTLSFKLQSLDISSPRTATWTVDYGFGATPTTFTPATTTPATLTTGGSSFTNTTVTVSFGTALDNQSGPVWIRIVTLSNTTGSGNRPSTGIDDVQLSWGADTTPPTIASLNPANNATNVGLNANLVATFDEPIQKGTGNITIRRTSDNSIFEQFDVTDSRASVSGAVLTIDPSGTFAGTTGYYVEIAAGAIKDLAGNNFAGITGSGTWSFTTTDPLNIVEPFDGPGLPAGWTAVSVVGAQVWTLITSPPEPSNRVNSAPGAVRMNGFSSGPQNNEDWLISPAFDLTPYNFPILSFFSRAFFNGALPQLELYVTTNYTGNPTTTTWTRLNGKFPTGTGFWQQTTGINLAPYKSTQTRIAFRYISSTTAGAAEWTIDDFALTNQSSPPPPAFGTTVTGMTNLHFGFVNVSANSAPKTLLFSATDITTNLTVTAPPQFQISKDGITYSSTLTYTPTEAAAFNTLYVRFSPTAANAFSGRISFVSGSSINTQVGYLSGSSLPTSSTLDVMTWNIEWFGSTTQGPSDEALQLQNVRDVILNSQADVIGLNEVANVGAFNNLIAALNAATAPGTFAGSLSPFTSQSYDAVDGQRVGFIWRTAVVNPISFRALLTEGVSTTSAPPPYAQPGYSLPSYPGGDPTRYWSSGRFPYLMVANVTIGSITKRMHFISIHARANGTESAADQRYNMRRYDVEVLRDSLLAQFPDADIVMLGDYNDDVDETVANNPYGRPPGFTESSYIAYVNDLSNFRVISDVLSNAGLRSFPSFDNMIDHIMISDELFSQYIPGGTRVVYANEDIPNYLATTSDHLPVMARFNFNTGQIAGNYQTLPIATSVTAASNVSITNTGTLTLNDVINLNGKTLRVNNSAPGAVTGTGHTFNGTVVRAIQSTGTPSYLFPIGTSTDNRSATVTFTTAPGGTNPVLTAFFNSSDPGTTGLSSLGLTNIWREGFWTINQTGNPTGTYNLSLNTAGISGINNPTTVRIIRRTTGSGTWVGATVIQANSSSTASLITAEGFSGFSEFSLSSESDNPLPVELVAFAGTATSSGVRLSWQTASELNNAGFEVRRSENDGEFVTIASYQFSPELRGKGTTSSATNYAFLDATVEAGKSYTYRLRSVDVDGAMHDYAQTVTIEVREPVQTRVYEYALDQNYPNPFNPSTMIRFTMKQAGVATLVITDVLGRVVMQEQMQARVGENFYRFTAQNLGSGVYFYTLRAPGFQQTKKMMLVK
ncbi:MAG: Ig-like domain-containing protein [Candidatus Thermochlorobacter sp.]